MHKNITFTELKEKALSYAKFEELNRFIAYGSVASALLTKNGNIYTGVSIDTACSMGFCAEHGAVAEMLKNRESDIVKILAVTEDGNVVPPCGRCRELISQLSVNNVLTEVMVDNNIVVLLKDLLPYDWKATVKQ